MKTYIGTKIIKAELITYQDFYNQTGKNPLKLNIFNIDDNIKDNEDIQILLNQKGYKVEYENNYISWSPKDVFEKAYIEIDKNIFDQVELLTTELKNKKYLANLDRGVIKELIMQGITLGITSSIKNDLGKIVKDKLETFKEQWFASVGGQNSQPSTFKELFPVEQCGELKTFNPIYHYIVDIYDGEGISRNKLLTSFVNIEINEDESIIKLINTKYLFEKIMEGAKLDPTNLENEIYNQILNKVGSERVQQKYEDYCKEINSYITKGHFTITKL